jgi:hypothetical protein
MSPLADAVCFINCQQAQRDRSQLSPKRCGFESFWGNVQQSHAPCMCFMQSIVHVACGHTSMDRGCCDASLSQPLGLVAHQCNQWRDHER